MNDIIRLSICNVPAHLASRSSNSRRGLLFSPRPIPSTSPSFSLHHLVISVDLRICVTSEGLFWRPLHSSFFATTLAIIRGCRHSSGLSDHSQSTWAQACEKERKEVSLQVFSNLREHFYQNS